MNNSFINAKLHAQHSLIFAGVAAADLLKLGAIEQIYKTLYPDAKEKSADAMYREIEEKLRDVVSRLYKVLPGYFGFRNLLVNGYAMKLEIDNLKLIARAYLNGKKKCSGLIDTAVTTWSISAEDFDFSDLESLKKVLVHDAGRKLIELLAKEQHIVEIDSFLDRYYFTKRIRAVTGSAGGGNSILKHALKVEADIYNVLWALRCNRYYKKRFQDIKDTFIMNFEEGAESCLAKIMDADLDEEDVVPLFTGGYEYLRELLKDAMSKEGKFDLILFEKKAKAYVNAMYARYFYRASGLSVPISYLHVIQAEYELLVEHITVLFYGNSREE